MRRTGSAAATALLLTTATLASGAGPAPGATITDPVRAAMAVRIDGAVVAAARVRVHRQRIVALRLAGITALVVARDATLADVRRAAPRAVRNPRPGVWSLDRLLVVTHGATLTVASPQVRELRLVSRGGRFATLVGQRASLRFAGRRGHDLVVRSWDVRTRAPDAVLEDGRASVSVRDGGRLDARNTSFEDLGFTEGRVSGVAVVAFRNAAGIDPPRRSRPSGTLVRSRFVRNVFGGYSYEAYAMRWIDDAFLDNAVYGLDPHDNSDGFLVEGNLASGNGRHGIIFSRFCDHNVIRHNRTLHNGWHGIVIDDGKGGDGPSDHNAIVDNDVRGNGKVGISIDGSSDNLIANNRVDTQRDGVRVLRRSSGNVVRDNRISNSAEYGVFLDRPRGTRVEGNTIRGASTGARLRDAPGSSLTGNALVAMRSHGVKVDGRAGPGQGGIVVADNRMDGQGKSPVLSDVPDGYVDVHGNRERWNYPLVNDLARALGWFVGPGLWLALLAAAILVPVPLRLGRRVRRRS